ncbi:MULTISPECIES: dTDP-4-dehydrorhamnose 3,5-epimerase [Alcaligenes]|uniref:dTDP-4-dehydrorhamnose 3,5-epimerase n=2 Tax=Alcaligenes TaxID=507 RepID=A0AAE9H8S2_ALCFA|nr:dTDP-4-dehydrorhamnose 3,5-epimerase [Alcaligenes faecalis]ATI01019.1 dTDP-4-dehydrorhamnose 3,5-epimerase [Alcaligenes faecalis]AYZ90378.1 dTDP-4-dehydrorhamnose 3,5-epimerase [Alcaligenes faecalis]MCX5594990.1 dTDP-4-dehydrorhamnose 3,5-epimerase [Alcaligenes faecalis]QQC33801.1 dTDP-4-dehydrorhamnose 3,5-epimerase [Alcaligenes faecalis]UPL21885.1 dTDP-4-dehydrorhamnose 3,5-epimerase [Alcaligenes faecalis]
MRTHTTHLPGVLIIEPRVFNDERGFFKESFNAARYQAVAGIESAFIQDNQSYSKGSVLRGLHFQKTRPQGKLISVTRGAIFDVVVDIDPRSTTFGQYVGLELSQDNHRQLWVAPGYAHGFCVLSDEADISYKCTDYYQPDDEGGLAWDCPRLAINWPIQNPVLSAKDRSHPGLEQFLLP